MKLTNLSLKTRLFLPIVAVIVSIIIGLSLWYIRTSINNYNQQLHSTLELQVRTIYKMFERESILKHQMVQTRLKVASALFEDQHLTIKPTKKTIEVQNQETGLKHVSIIDDWMMGYEKVYGDTFFVDSLSHLLGGMVTLFQKIDSGYVRLSTNVQKANGQRAVGTYIPNTSPVAKALSKKNTYFGRALVVDSWHTTAYKPIVSNDDVIGAIYVGDKEKDLTELKKLLNRLKIGKSGYSFVFQKDGQLLIHPTMQGSYIKTPDFLKKVIENDKGTFNYTYNNQRKTYAFKYFQPFDLYIAATVYSSKENKTFITNAIIGTSIVSMIAIAMSLVFLYFFTSKKLYTSRLNLQLSNKKIAQISAALKESEERFQKLFDSTGDSIFVTDINENIVEINNAACKTLGYSRAELLSMKISDIKTYKYKAAIAENRKKIYELGTYAFESEHITKNGSVIAVEFLSRLINYKNDRLILSVVRNISHRKELERKILSAVIKAEERERERFAKDMHDGLGPLLSTIKLYVNELKSETLKREEREDLIKSSNELLDEAVNATRTISNNLMPRIINAYGLIKALKEFCNKVNKTNQIIISFETENITERLSPDIELILFRVSSELINNTLKHAQANKVLILLVKYDTKIALYYKDDGIGFDTELIMNDAQKGMGLKNIISRVKSINGTYIFSSAPGNGFLIKIEFDI